MTPTPAPAPAPAQLRRDVTVWGSFMWGYADVGADIYTALGLVMAAAQGATPLAFGLAGLVYIFIGLGYTELASAYPAGGGGQFYAVRGLGDFWGFVAGAALLLDYTIDIALFSVASAGYMTFFWPYLFGHPYVRHAVDVGGLTIGDPLLAGLALGLIAALVLLNVRGIKESSLFNEILGGIDIATESSIIIFGFCFAWRPELLAQQWQATLSHFSFHDFAYGSSLAIISFVGLESISQAAQETRRPATIIPRTSITLIFTVFIFALAFSTLALGVLPWEVLAARKTDPVATLAHHIPLVGVIAGPFTAFLGLTILAISANSGIMSASRLTFSMSRLGLVSSWLDHVHPRYRTPVRAVVWFSLVGALQVLAAAFTPDLLDTLANLYAFGATLGYILVFLALIKLRFTDPYTPRPYQMPINLPWTRKDGVEVSVPVLGAIGIAGVSMIFFQVVYTHRIGRIAGPAWVLAAIIYYLCYRAWKKRPLFGSVKRDWEKEHIEALQSAEEFDLLEQYKSALAARDRKRS
jgi:APA family basic amino acid/polyamine antiporter